MHYIKNFQNTAQEVYSHFNEIFVLPELKTQVVTLCLGTSVYCAKFRIYIRI